MKTILKIFFALLIYVSSDANAQTNTWQSLGTGLQNGTNNHVYAITAYNGKIIFGGSFSRAGSINVQNIAAYDPVTNTWSALGAGLNGEVRALTLSGSDLIAGGSFTQAGITPANRVARWNGTNWSAMSTGFGDDVNTLIVYSGSIIAGGNFSMPGGADNVARWNGSAWVTMGNGLTGSGDRVNAFTIYQGNLVAGGRFEESGANNMKNIAKWNGSVWSAFNGDSFDGNVNAAVVYNNELYAGGDFMHIGGNDRKYIAKWNGSSWVSVGGGLDDGPVEAFSVFKNTLIVGGNFRVTGTGLFVDRIAGWNGSSWSRLLTGHNDHVYALHTYNSTDTMLYSGGEFTTAGGKWCYFAAKWGPVNNVSVSGTAKYQNGQNVLFGKIRIIRMDVVTKELIFVDSAQVINGNYTLNRVPRGDTTLRVMIFPDDELLDEPGETNYVPTFYPSTIQWVQAGILYANSNLQNINIVVVPRAGALINDNPAVNLGGYVYLNILPPANVIITGFPFLRGTVVYLKQDTSYVSSDITDENQQYSFTGLQAGTYSLTVQRIGYETETRQITLGGVNQDTVNFYLDTINVIGIINISTNIPDNFSLKQNYPNPFNPQTRIRFDVKKQSFTELKVFDVLGREVATLVSENLKPGEYEADFTAIRLTSGVYFYRLTAEGYSETRKMILLK